MTTHIICLKETTQLRQELNALDSRIREGATNQKDAIMTDRLHVVTIDWLKMCLCRQQKISEVQYKPEVEQNATFDKKRANIKSRTILQYAVKKNLFGKVTFAVQDETFEKQDEHFTEMLRKKIIENGGQVLSGNSKAHYVIFEDGHD